MRIGLAATLKTFFNVEQITSKFDYVDLYAFLVILLYIVFV